MENKYEEQQTVKTEPENKDTKQRMSASGRAAISILTAFFLSGLVLTCSLPLDVVSYANTRGIPVATDLETWFIIPTTADGELKDISLSFQSEAGKYYSIELLGTDRTPANGFGINVSSLAGSTQYLSCEMAGTALIFQPDGPVKVSVHSSSYLTGMQVRCRAIPTLESGIPVTVNTYKGSMDVYRVPFNGGLPVDYFVQDELISTDFTAKTSIVLCKMDGTVYSPSVVDYSSRSGCILPPAGETAFFIKINTFESNGYSWENGIVSYEILVRNPELHTLANDAWSDGSLKMGTTLWYTYPAIAGENYWVYLDDSVAGSGTKTGVMNVSTMLPGFPVESYENNSYYNNAYQLSSGLTGDILVRILERFSYSKNSSQNYTHRLKITKAVTTDLSDNVWHDTNINQGETQYFRIPVTAGETYSVNWDDAYDSSAAGKTALVSVSATNADNSVTYFSNESSGYSYPRTISPIADGYIRISVTGTSTGTFGIRVKKRIAVQLTDNVWTDSSIGYIDMQDFVMAVSAGDTYIVNWDDDLGNSSGGKTGQIYVSATNADGSVIYFNNATSGYFSPRTVIPTQDGYLKLSVKCANAAGSFSIKVHKLITTQLTEGTWCHGNLSVGDIQYFSMALDPSCVYTIKTNDAASGDGTKTATTRLSCTIDGNTFVEQTRSNFSTGLEFLSAGGTMNIQVNPVDSTHTGTYSIVVSKITVPTLADNVWTTGTIATGSPFQYFYVPFSGSGTCYLSWDDSYSGSSTYTLDVAVYATNGTTTFLNRADSAYDSYATLTPGGPFWIKVEPWSSSGTGTFAIRYKTTP